MTRRPHVFPLAIVIVVTLTPALAAQKTNLNRALLAAVLMGLSAVCVSAAATEQKTDSAIRGGGAQQTGQYAVTPEPEEHGPSQKAVQKSIGEREMRPRSSVVRAVDGSNWAGDGCF